jgi:hypothetical protein
MNWYNYFHKGRFAFELSFPEASKLSPDILTIGSNLYSDLLKHWDPDSPLLFPDFHNLPHNLSKLEFQFLYHCIVFNDISVIQQLLDTTFDISPFLFESLFCKLYIDSLKYTPVSFIHLLRQAYLTHNLLSYVSEIHIGTILSHHGYINPATDFYSRKALQAILNSNYFPRSRSLLTLVSTGTGTGTPPIKL